LLAVAKGDELSENGECSERTILTWDKQERRYCAVHIGETDMAKGSKGGGGKKGSGNVAPIKTVKTKGFGKGGK
jgi:hypothetical protein